MKAFTVLTKTVHAAKTDLKRLDSLIKWLILNEVQS